ncbi:MAG: hypothetical protein ABWY26_10755 [Microbacterium sp.]
MSEMRDDDDVTAIDRLAERFPTLAREHIAQVVHEERDRLSDARIRDFIPVLVEHSATERLRREARPELSATVDAEPTHVPVEPPGLDPMEVERRLQPPGGPLLGNAGGG